MKTGLVIAKDTYTIEGAPDELYVDSNTPMLKVFKNVSGALVINADGSYSSVGDYSWTNPSANNYSLVITTDNLLNYAPQFEAYMDKDPDDKRTRLNNLVAGVGLTGHCNAFAFGVGSSVEIRANVTGTPPFAGSYGYFVQIYYDRASRP
jgi:hypothetical protein